MARRVRWTPPALNSLNEIADYISRDSRHYAAVFVRKVKTASRSLSTMPLRGRMVPEFQEADPRELLLGSYRLIFRILGNEVQILEIIHQARELKSLPDH